MKAVTPGPGTTSAPDVPEPDYGLPARRRSELLKVAGSRRPISVVETATQFAVSADTIRRDLDYLADRGLLARTHGGAVPLDHLTLRDVPVGQRLNDRAAEKARIARAAAVMIADGETLIIYGGSTTRAFVAELGARRNITIVTNDLAIPAAVPAGTARAVYVLGGQVLTVSQITIGAIGFPGAGPMRFDTVVLGVGGVSTHGFSTTLLEEASMMAAMLASGRRVLVLADAAKLGQTVFAHVAPLDDVDILVTDREPAPDLASALDDAGVAVVVAP